MRDLVLAASSGRARAGALEPNPAYTLAARLSGEAGPTELAKTMALWAALLLGVAVLALLTLRVARREAPSTDEQSGSEPGG